MKRGLLSFFVIAILGGIAEAAPWESLPPDHWAYLEIRWLQVQGYLRDLNPSQAPYRRGEIARALQKDPQPNSGVAAERFQLLENEFDPDMSPSTRWQGFAGGRLIIGAEGLYGQTTRSAGYGVTNIGIGNHRLGVFTSQRGDRDLAENPEYSGKKWNNLTGFTESAYAVYTAARWELMLGRDHLAWGPGSDHLLLNDSPRGGDRIAFKVHWNWGQFTGFIGQVSGFTDTSNHQQDRYLSGHRLDIMPWPWLQFGLSETILWSGSPRLGFMNPFLPYYGELVNENSDGNGLLSFDFNAWVIPGTQFFGEILLDDIQLENKKPKDLEPPLWGWLIGGRWAGLEGLWGAELYYQGVTNRTYNAEDPRLRYQNYGLPLGSDLGNDGDLLRAQLSCWPAARIRIDGFGQMRRRGEGRVNAVYDTSYTNYTIQQGYSEPFPTGIVEKTQTLGLSFSVLPNSSFQAQGVFGYDWINNAGNVADLKTEGVWGRITLGMWFERVIRF
jgi:hypothetical protein